jgi:hypothetical protein
MADEENEAARLAREALENLTRLPRRINRVRQPRASMLERVLEAQRRRERHHEAVERKAHKVRKYSKVLEASLAREQHARGVPWMQIILRDVEIGEASRYTELCERYRDWATKSDISDLWYELQRMWKLGLVHTKKLPAAQGPRAPEAWLTAEAAEWQEVARRNRLWRFQKAQIITLWKKADDLDNSELLPLWLAHAYPLVAWQRASPWARLPAGYDEADELWIPPRLREHALLQAPRRRSDRTID